MATRVPLAHTILALDPSVSVQRNCRDLRDGTKTFLESKAGIREGSTLTMLVMGRSAHNPNPKAVFSELIPVPLDTVYGDKEAQKQAEAQFYARIEQVCEAEQGGSGSPIYELVQQGIAQLRGPALGCKPEGRCYYLIKTDLDDDVKPALRAVLQRAVRVPDVPLPPEFARSIDNAGIEITFCGVAEVTDRRTSGASAEVRMRIWKELFTHPELVSFQPFCK
jgi:hypothetical protein